MPDLGPGPATVQHGYTTAPAGKGGPNPVPSPIRPHRFTMAAPRPRSIHLLALHTIKVLRGQPPPYTHVVFS